MCVLGCVGLLDALSKIAGAARGKPPEAIVKLLDDARQLVRAGLAAKQQQQQNVRTTENCDVCTTENCNVCSSEQQQASVPLLQGLQQSSR